MLREPVEEAARLIIADALRLDQKPVGNRLLIAIPLFVASGFLLWFNFADENGFNVIWRYFGWSNQTLAVFTLWTITVYLSRRKIGMWYLITLIPACFMTAVSLSFIIVDKVGFGITPSAAPWIGLSTFALSAILFYIWKCGKVNKKSILD